MALPVFQATIVNQAGDIIPSPVITVIDETTGLPPSLFSDRNGTVPLGTNGVFTGGTDGFAQFFAASGNYRVKAELASAGFEQTWDFVAMVGDSAFYEVGSGASQLPTNADLPTFGTAAEADVQTSPTDATEGALLNNETTHIGGEVNYTGANYQPSTTLGIGVLTRMYNASGSAIVDQATISGGSLQKTRTDLSGNVVGTVVAAGIYRYVGGGTLPIDGIGDFVRES